MMELTKEFSFACSHRLENHKGLCKNLHGHNYKVLVTVEHSNGETDKTEGTDKGMVIDFKDLKKNVNIIIDSMDHAFIYNVNDADSAAIAQFLKDRIDQKLYDVKFRTTTENLAKWIYHSLNHNFNEMKMNVVCTKVMMYESESSDIKYGE